MLIDKNTIHNIDALSGLQLLPDQSINCIVTSPPYWGQRVYLPNTDPNKKYELGQEPYFKDYIDNLCAVFKEAKRVLRDDGCCFVNLGDTYFSSSKGTGGPSDKQLSNSGSRFDAIKLPKQISEKSLCNIPYRFAIKMTDDLGWIQRNLIIWRKGNQFPSSALDRFTVNFEPVLFFTKSKKYWFQQQIEPFSNQSNPNEVYTGQATKDYESVGAQNPSDSKRRILESMKKRGGRNKRCVWDVNVKPVRFQHTACFPEALVEPMIKAGCPEGGIVLDLFMGAGTSAVVAQKLNRRVIGFEINPEYIDICYKRLNQ